MRFTPDPELQLFAESVRRCLAGWESPLEPVFGTWWDERDDDLAGRLRVAGWSELWLDSALLGPAVVGAIELGRVCAPLSLVDEATLGAPLLVGGRVRHLVDEVALLRPADSLAHASAAGGEREATLDGNGTVRDVVVRDERLVADAAARWHAWGAASLGYLAGLADGALETAIAHVQSREQFGAPLGRLPTMQGRLAESALTRDGVLLCAWAAADPDSGFPAESLSWAVGAVREVTAEVLQAHGAIGFALEGGVHRCFRRAKAMQVWTEGLLALREPEATLPRR